MSEVAAKGVYVSLDSNDLSQYVNDSDWTRKPDEQDLTCYGADEHVVRGSLLGGSSGLTGKYDSTASTGPRAVIEPLIGTNVTYVDRPEGTGTGKPERSVDVLVGQYKETRPVAGYIMWTLDLTHSGPVTQTTQA